MGRRWGIKPSIAATALATAVLAVLGGCSSSVQGSGSAQIAAVPGQLPGSQMQSTAAGSQPSGVPAGDTPAAVPPTTTADPGGQTGGQPAGQTGGAAPAVQTDLSWLKPGARATYEFRASSSSDRTTWTEDPGGSLYDPKTGKRYSADRGLQPASQAAEGVVHYDVAGVDGSGAAVLVRQDILLDPLGSGTWTPFKTTIEGQSTAKPGQAWIHPNVLVQLQGTGNDQDQVVVGPIDFNGQQVQAQVFLNNNNQNYYFHAYDLATGLLLRSDTSTYYAGNPSPTSPNATTTTGTYVFKSLRQRTVPIGNQLPSWVAQGATLSYSGQYALMDSSTGQPMQGSAVPISDQLVVGQTGPTWATYQVTRQYQDGTSKTADGVITSASTYLMDPAALATMQAGQVLDTDPVTGEKWSVVEAGNGQVVIAIESTGTKWLGAYETSTGRLLQAQLTNPLSFTQVQLAG